MTPHIGISCPQCRHELQVRTEYLGQRVRCRYCRSAFLVQSGNGQGHGSGSGEFPVVPSGEFAAVPDHPADVLGPGLPGYQSLGLIRNGSMGRVYKARQSRVERPVAVKVLHHALASSPEYVDRFRREATFAARLAHSNIPYLIDAGDVGGCPYLVMEFAEGETALDRLETRGVFSEAAAVAVAVATAEALDHVHRHGLIHRDVKPANLILTPDGGLKLIDFGLARPTGDEDWAAAEAGNAIGTPEYISPEQTRGQADLDPRSDLYGLGATLYHLVTGCVPYSGTSLAIIRQHADPRARPVPADQMNPALGAGIVSVIEKLLSKNREARYRRPAELLDDLRRISRNG